MVPSLPPPSMRASKRLGPAPKKTLSKRIQSPSSMLVIEVMSSVDSISMPSWAQKYSASMVCRVPKPPQSLGSMEVTSLLVPRSVTVPTDWPVIVELLAPRMTGYFEKF